MVRALIYLRLMSAWNALTTRALRLRQPKYLAGALATAAYFYYFVFRRMAPPLGYPGGAGSTARTATAVAGMVSIGSSLLILILMIGWVAVAWLFPAAKPGLRFSPAEINFLFPAPVTRRTLVHYSLLSSQLRIILSAVFLGVIWSRRGFTAEAVAIHAAGWWIIFSVADLHKSGANLSFARFSEQGLSAARARQRAAGAVWLYVAAVAACVWHGARAYPESDADDMTALARYAAGLLSHGLLHGLLLPFQMLEAPFFAANGRAFLLAVGPALALLAAHYYWVTRLETSFAEGSINLAEKRAQLLAARSAGLGGPIQRKARAGPFLLAPRGRPETAFLWKNLISISSTLHWRVLFLGALLAVQGVILGMSLSARDRGGHFEVALVVVFVAALLVFYVLFFGAQLARQDLRNDIGNMDILKTYPLRGWNVVLGELLTPIAILSSLLWILLLAAVSALCYYPGSGVWQAPGVLLAGGVCAACVVPPVCALELLVPNAAMLLFPAWHQATRSRTGGIEMMGQRLIFVFGQFFVIALMLLPAVVATPVIVFATQWLIGIPAALVAATAIDLVILGAELWIGLWWLGARFEKLDIAAELRP